MGSRALAYVALLVALSGCTGTTVEKPAPPLPMTLTSSAFTDGSAIPPRFTCDGENISPPLAWSQAPAEADRLTLLVADRDAGGFIHWSVGRIPPGTREVKAGRVPPGALQTANGFKRRAYGGPCPPGTSTHRYVFRIQAFAPGKGLVAAGDLNGTYARAAAPAK